VCKLILYRPLDLSPRVDGTDEADAARQNLALKVAINHHFFEEPLASSSVDFVEKNKRRFCRSSSRVKNR
jgi:hypothetical protein